MADSCRVLVIDDDPLDYRFVQRALVGLDGWTAQHLESLDALNAAAPDLSDTPPNVVLLDVRLPGVAIDDPAEGLRRCRELFPRTPVVLWSGHSEVELVRELALQGAAAFLVKSANRSQRRQLLATLTRVRQRPNWSRQFAITDQTKAHVHRVTGEIAALFGDM